MQHQGNTLPKIHQWLVVRGRASIWSESPKIVLELDPEGSAYCVLSAQDAVEIAGIFAGEARAIWESSEKQNADPARVEGDITKSCKLWTATGVLQLIVHDTEPLIAIILDSGSRCELDVTRAIALVQVLQYMTGAIEQRA